MNNLPFVKKKGAGPSSPCPAPFSPLCFISSLCPPTVQTLGRPTREHCRGPPLSSKMDSHQPRSHRGARHHLRIPRMRPPSSFLPRSSSACGAKEARGRRRGSGNTTPPLTTWSAPRHRCRRLPCPTPGYLEPRRRSTCRPNPAAISSRPQKLV